MIPLRVAVLCGWLVCSVAAQNVVIDTTSSSTTKVASLNATSPNATDGKGGGHRGQSIHVVALEFEAVKEPLIFTVVVLLAGLSKIGFHHADFLSSRIPESCVLIILGTIFGAILHFSNMSGDLPELFNPHRFFIFLLPPIILEAAFSLYDRTFSENLGTVLLFAVVGTIISCFLIGLALYGLMMAGAMGEIRSMSLVQILIFSALIVAVDPVAVLAVFTEIGVNDVLYFIVFGESLLNDGVTVVLYKVMQSLALMETVEVSQVFLGIAKFFVVCFGGLLLGVIAGVVSALLTRLTVHVGVAQPLVIYTMAYLGFLMSELFEVSGIISIIGCGLVQRHYAFCNISHKSRTTVKYFTKVLASASEIIIFLFLGLALFSEKHEWHTGFVVWTILLCTLFRFMVTFGMACLVNQFDTMRVRLIGYDEMFMIAFGGLRGAVAFSLAALLDENDLPMKTMFVTSTLAVVMFTVFIQGITIKPLVNLLSITLAPEKNQSMYCELNNHVVDHLMAGIEDVAGKRGRNHIREKIEQVDSHYLKRWLMNEPDPIDSSIQDFYTKIVIKEHYKNLKLCGAANVAEPRDLPHIETSMYLDKMAANEDASGLAAQQASQDAELKEIETPVIRRRFPARFNRDGNDLQGLRNLLKSQRKTRLNLHSLHDRNLTTDLTSNLQNQIVKKSVRNRKLQRLMSTTAHSPLQRCASWGDKDAQIAVERADAPEKGFPNKRAVSLDLGASSVSYRPLTQGQVTAAGTPVTSGLDSVCEEDEENPRGVQSDPGVEGEKHPLMSDPDRSASAPLKGRKDTQSGRKRLKRQDDLKSDDTRSQGSDDIP